MGDLTMARMHLAKAEKERHRYRILYQEWDKNVKDWKREVARLEKKCG
jgi:hypothetical protein